MTSTNIQKLLVGLTMLTPVFMLGCTATNPVAPQASPVKTEKRYSQAQVDLLVAEARAEEQARINKVLVKQLKQLTVNERLRVEKLQVESKKAFKRLSPSSSAQSQQTTFVQQEPLTNKNQDTEVVTLKPTQETKQKQKQTVVQTKPTQKANSSKVAEVIKIVPVSRTPVLYREVGGAKYYRCAANALVAVRGENGWQYSSDKEELSATLCKKSRDRATMTDLQYSLYEKGYLQSATLSKGQLIDGIWGQTTLEALKAYQREHGLLLGQLTIQSLEHLGVFKAE